MDSSPAVARLAMTNFWRNSALNSIKFNLNSAKAKFKPFKNFDKAKIQHNSILNSAKFSFKFNKFSEISILRVFLFALNQPL